MRTGRCYRRTNTRPIFRSRDANRSRKSRKGSPIIARSLRQRQRKSRKLTLIDIHIDREAGFTRACALPLTQLSKKPRIAVCSCTRWIGHSDRDSRLFCCKPLPSGRFISEDFRAVGSALASLVSSGFSWGHSATRRRHVRSLDSTRFHRRRDRGNRAPPSAP